jgi:photosystem II stability/assembly factor-like uncharacterized protein
MKIIKTILALIIAFNSFGQSVHELTSNHNMTFENIQNSVESLYQNKAMLTGSDSSDLKSYARWEQFWKTRLNTDGTTGYTDAPDGGFVTCGSLGNWQSEGPNTIPSKAGNVIYSNGIGRIESIAVYKQNHNIVYVGSNTGGLFKSTDLGNSWQSVFDIDSIRVPGLGIVDIVIHPTNPDIVWIATGLTGPLETQYGAGIYKTTNGGQIWVNVSHSFGGNTKYKIVADIELSPSNANELYVTYEDKIMKSLDGGNTFTVFRTDPNGRTFDKIKMINSGGDMLLYVTSLKEGSNPSKIWRYVVNTSTWMDITDPNMTGKRFFIDVTPAAPDNLYLEYKGKVFLSTDRGNTYTFKTTAVSGQETYRNALAVSSTEPNVFYVGGRRVHRTINEGNNFLDYDDINNIHVDIHSIVNISSSPLGSNGSNDSLLIGTDGGVSLIVGASSVYKKTHNALNITQSWECDVHVYGADYKVMGTQDNGTMLKDGSQWKKISAGDGGSSMLTEFSGKEYVIHSENSRIFLSDINQLSTRKSIEDNICTKVNMSGDLCLGVATHTTAFMLDTQDPSVFYFGLHDVYKHDLTASNIYASQVNITPTLNLKRYISDLAMSHSNSNLIYLSTDRTQWDVLPVIDSALFKTTDGGATWTGITPEWAARENASITDIEVNPDDDQEIWITLGGFYNNKSGNTWSDALVNDKVFHSTNGGVSWTNFSHGLENFPVHQIKYEKGTNDRLYLATDVGVYYRDQSMTQWECFNSGLPSVVVMDLEINYCTRKIYAATYGRGLWSANLLPPRKIYAGSVNGEVWSTDKKLYQSIHIQPGKKLTINNATISMAAGTKIIVDQGAELILISSTLTNECGAFWDGIEVWGNSLFSTNTQYCPSGSSCLTGKLTMNYSTIENADNAVRLWNPNDWNMRGGMIYASSSFFKNNRRDVEFMAFENHHVGGANNGQIAPYRSAFYKCDFIIDTNYLFDVKPPRDAMVTLWQVRGIDFNGCDFRNISGQSLNKAGIYSWDADYTVKEWCNQYPCGNPIQSHFIGLKAGIDATSSGMGYGFMVDTANFINCDYGVVANGVQNAIITRNSFSLNTTGFGVQPPSSIGIYLNVADQFTVTQNKMDAMTTGILARSTGGTDNVIRKNGFVNAYIGNMAYKDNNDKDKTYVGLRYECNLHQNPGIYDITIHGGTGIAENQGTPTFAADNAFTSSSTSFPEKHIANNSSIGVIMNYFHHSNSAGYILKPTNVDPFKVLTFDIQTQFNIADNCLSSIDHFLSQDRGRMDQQKGDSERSAFNGAKSNYNQAKYVYISTVDGGDTYGLLNTVQNTNVQDAWNLRNDLIGDAPLSDEVIIEVINDGLLSNALLLDVLIVNPHASRNEEIVSLLETKTVPMPAYMINTFLGLFEVLSQRDVLEAEIAHEAIAMNKSARLLIAHWSADSTGDDWDSIPVLLADIPTPLADMQRIAFYRGIGNTAQANQILSVIADQHELTAWQENMIAGVEELYNLYDQTVSGGIQVIKELAPSTESALTTYSVNEDTRKGVYAKSWLKFSQDELYLPEMVTYNPPAGKKEKQSVFELRDVKEEVIFEIFPNPTRDYITINSGDYTSENIIRIEIINSIGNVVISNQKMNNKRYNLNLGGLPSGMYLIRILDGNKEIQKQMLEVIK